MLKADVWYFTVRQLNVKTSHKASVIPGVPQGQLVLERPRHPSACRFEDCEGGVQRPSQWSNSIKAGLCALFDEGCAKHH